MMIDEELPMLELSALDRCDRCGAQAHAVATSEFGELLFCTHHIKKSYQNLIDEAWTVTLDEDAVESMALRSTYTAPV